MSTAPPTVGATSDSNGREGSPAVTWIVSLALFTLLVALIVWFSNAAACFDLEYKAGSWMDLGATFEIVAIFPLLGAGCCALAWILLRRRAHRLFAACALAVSFLLGCPVIALPLARSLSATGARFWLPRKSVPEKAKLERSPSGSKRGDPWTHASLRHYNVLAAQFAEPQVISHAEFGMILLEDHKIVTLYGIYFSTEVIFDLTSYVNENLINKRVVLRLPNRELFMKSYTPGPMGISPPSHKSDFFDKPNFFDLSPTDFFGLHYGRIPCLVYVDGRLLNSRYKGTKGSLSDFGEYETQPGPSAATGERGGTHSLTAEP